MASKYLRDVYFKTGMQIHPRVGKSINDVTLALFRALPLRNFIFQRLRKDRCILSNGVRDILIRLTDQPLVDPEIFKNSDTTILYIDVDFDPNQLVDLENKNEIFGPLYAKLLRSALEKVRHIDDLPFETINGALKAYEDSGFCYKYKVGERMIPGTKLKGTMRAELSCERLVRKLQVSYRGKQLLETIIADQEEIPVYYNHFPGFKMEGQTLLIGSQITDRDLATVDFSGERKIIEILEKIN